jgi:hypothetical protein
MNERPSGELPVSPPAPGPARPLPHVPAFWTDGLRAAAGPPVDWLWQGYLAPGNVTMLTSQWKSGKTTLLSVLLARLGSGGQLAGLPVRAAKVAVVTEEAPSRWLERAEKLGIGNHVCWFCRPFRGKPTGGEWLALLERLLELRRRDGIELVAVDPLALFLPGRDESHAGLMLEALAPLQRLTAEGVSALLLHHPRKGSSAPGQAARGSGALPGFVDIALEMHHVGRAAVGGRRRRLVAFSRYEETPRQLVIELNAGGTDYLCHDARSEDDFLENWEQLRAALAGAPRKLTRRQVAKRWPGGPPHGVTVWRWLEQAVFQGLVCRDGSGRKRDPYRYWLREREEQWREAPEGRRMLEKEEEDRKFLELVLEVNRRALESGRAPNRPGAPGPEGRPDVEGRP